MGENLLGVSNFSPRKRWPRWPPQLAQVISVLRASQSLLMQCTKLTNRFIPHELSSCLQANEILDDYGMDAEMDSLIDCTRNCVKECRPPAPAGELGG